MALIIGTQSGTGTGATRLVDLTDVTILSVAANDVLTWDGVEWVNQAPDAVITDHGGLTGLTDDDHAIYIYAYPGDNSRNVVAPLTADITALTLKASSGTFSSAHDVFAVQTHTGVMVAGLYKATAGQYYLRFNTNGSAAGTFGYIKMNTSSGMTCGYLDTSANAFGSGGSITTNAGTDTASNGGAINTAGGDFSGGSLNLSGGAAAVGGSIDTSNGGGSILTNSITASYIRLGTAAKRVIITTASPGSSFTATLPNVTGTFCVAATSATATQALFATTTAGSPAYRAIAADDLGSGGSSSNYLRGDMSWQTVSAGASALDDLTDVTITTPGDDQFLRYDGAGWVNETVSLVTDHGALTGLTDDDHAVYIYVYPGDNTRNVIAPITADITALICKASSGTFSSAYDVFAVQSHTGTNVFNVNKTAASAYVVVLNTNASAAGTLGYIKMDASTGKTTGYINTSANANGSGGYIITNAGTDTASNGGNINTSGGDFSGGSINMSGGAAAVGGSINMSNGGGDISTVGSGSIGLGVSATRTSLIGSGSAVTCTFPAITGTLMSLAGAQSVSGAKTFANSTLLLAGAGAGVATVTYANSANSRTYTLPDFGGNTSVVLADTSTTTTHVLFATATAGAPAYRAIAASDVASGTLVHERGGLEADVSAYSGLVKITGGATSAVPISTWGAQVLNSTVYVAGSDSTNSSNSANADVTGMVFTMAAGGKYLVEGYVLHYAAATTTGLSLTYSDVSSCQTAFLWYGAATTSAGQTKASIADDTIAAQSGSLSTSVIQLSKFSAYIDNTSGGSGSWQLRFCSEINTSTVTIDARSYMNVQTLA